MKLAWRKVTRGASMPAGRGSFQARRCAFLDRRVSAIVSAVGCFWMPRITAGLPSNPASPRLMAAREGHGRRSAAAGSPGPCLRRHREVLQVVSATCGRVADQVLAITVQFQKPRRCWRKKP